MKNEENIFGDFQLLALIGMIYGFVMIQNPEKTFNGSHDIEEVIHEEVEAEEGVADLENLENDEENTTDQILMDLANGTMDPKAEKYKELGLLRIQKHGIKGIHFNYFLKTEKEKEKDVCFHWRIGEFIFIYTVFTGIRARALIVIARFEGGSNSSMGSNSRWALIPKSLF
mgnify:CR=1 FL=1